jgi:hypothetical protein
MVRRTARWTACRPICSAATSIDRLNARRHHLVEQIDTIVDRALTQAASAVPATESPGMVLDRLSVLVIRIHQTELAAGAETPDAHVYAARLPAMHRHLVELQQAFDALLEEVREGKKRFVPYQSLKLYGQ